jgi:hypothetical protein
VVGVNPSVAIAGQIENPAGGGPTRESVGSRLAADGSFLNGLSPTVDNWGIEPSKDLTILLQSPRLPKKRQAGALRAL